MANPYHHAVSSVKKWGGCVEDYIAIHSWFDESKSHFADFRHRALRHHSEGIFEMEKIFGQSFINSDGKVVYTRYVGEMHVREDCDGYVPTAKEWIESLENKTGYP
jgi:hypothetical protein